MSFSFFYLLLFFFNDPASTEIYTLSLHDALPIFQLHASDDIAGIGFGNFIELFALHRVQRAQALGNAARAVIDRRVRAEDRKSTRLNSSHSQISYAVFCLKKKKKKKHTHN